VGDHAEDPRFEKIVQSLAPKDS